MPPKNADHSRVVLAVYVRRSDEMQKENSSIDAQRRAIKEVAKLHGLPEPICSIEQLSHTPKPEGETPDAA